MHGLNVTEVSYSFLHQLVLFANVNQFIKVFITDGIFWIVFLVEKRLQLPMFHKEDAVLVGLLDENVL